MLYLHCGWPRTSTSSLQAALSAYQEELAAVHILYPRRWRDPNGLAHHRIYALLSASVDSPDALEEFSRFLTRHSGEDVLLSAEGLSNWLLSPDRQGALSRFLGAARKVMPVKCLWSLRRLDDVLGSLYLLGLRKGIRLPSPTEFLNGVSYRPYPFDVRRPDELFAGLGRIEEIADVEITYVKYDSTGTHNVEFLREVGIPEPLVSMIQSTLESSRRRNVSVSEKEAIVLFNLEELAKRLGVELDRVDLIRAFQRGELRFDGDRRCNPLDESPRAALHRDALTAADRNGVMAYVRFFGGADVAALSPGGLDLRSLTDEDQKRLREYRPHSPLGDGCVL